MNIEFKRDKLVMQTNTKMQIVAGEPTDDGKLLKFPVEIQLGDKTVPLVDISVAFETKGGECLGSVLVTYYDAVNGQPKTSALAQFKVNPEQILLNNGITKTNEDEQILSLPSSDVSTEIVVEHFEEPVLPSVAAKLKKNSSQNPTQEI